MVQKHLRLREMGKYLMSKLKDIKSPLIKEVKGRGLLVGIELVLGTTKIKLILRLKRSKKLLVKT